MNTVMEKSRSKIVIVDDDSTNLAMARDTLSDYYDVFTAPSGEKMFRILERIDPDLILLDIKMPGMSGYEVIKMLKSDEDTVDIPVIFLTAAIDPESEVKGLSLGAIDYITKPFSQELLLKRIELHLLVEKQRKELKNYSQNLEKMVNRKTQTVFDLQNSILKTVAELIESRDNITGRHIERTQNFLRLFLSFLLKHEVYINEFSKWDLNLIVMSSQLHDVGKISIKDSILMKQGKLTNKEFEEMKMHTVYGKKIIEKIAASTPESAFLKHAKILAGSHHERWDGSGYPDGLKSNAIPLQGRLMAIVDVYDALTNDRPYKNAFSHMEALDIIRKKRAVHFDPVLCDIFLQHEEEFKIINGEGGEGGEGGADHLQTGGGIDWSSVPHIVAAAIVDARAVIDNGQTDRIRRYLTIFIDALKKNDQYKDEVLSWDINCFLLSAQMHNFETTAIKDSILHKPGEPADTENTCIKNPANSGVDPVRQTGEDMDEGSLFHHAEVLIGSRHEKWDGSGYPLGLKGTKIPLPARIMALVDVYDALISSRPYKQPMSPHEAAEEIIRCSGTAFDPNLVEVFKTVIDEFAQIAERHDTLI
jgi:putative two-component system response regulator